MRANSIVRQVVRELEGNVHLARLKAVSAAVLALIDGGDVGLTALGRAIGPSFRHGIKRIDRLLGNRLLEDELELFYGAIVRKVLGSERRPVILLDWTEAGTSMCALTAAVPTQGRAVTIYSVTVPQTQYAAPDVEKSFMETLRTLLGPERRPILVGDAGFRAPWMKQVRAMGWDFVTRIRGRTQVQRIGDDDWHHWSALYPEARRVPRTLGTYHLVRSRSVEAQLVIVDRRKRAPSGTPRNARAKRATKAHHEPWLLAASLTMLPKEVVRIYASRMQIELTFRDLKSHRFGWGFKDARCRSVWRVAVQILLAALASLVSLIFGLAAEAAGIRKQYQANTTTSRRTLSLVTLGRAVITTASVELHLPRLYSIPLFQGIR